MQILAFACSGFHAARETSHYLLGRVVFLTQGVACQALQAAGPETDRWDWASLTALSGPKRKLSCLKEALS